MTQSVIDSIRPLSHVNDTLVSGLALSKMEQFHFVGAEGANVQGFIVKPPNFDPAKKYPVKFLIHGGPQGAWGDAWSYRWNPELMAASGYVVVMVNPRGSTGYGQAFIDGVNGDWGGKAYVDLMKGLDAAEKQFPFIDKDRECALGASYGGFMANWILTHTNRFKCIVTHDGMYNPAAAYGDTEEMWFNEWEFRRAGRSRSRAQPWRYASLPASGRSFPQVVADAPHPEREDADAGDPLAEGLPAGCERGLPALYRAAAARRAQRDALLPRRRPLGAEAAERAVLEQDRQRLVRQVAKERKAQHRFTLMTPILDKPYSWQSVDRCRSVLSRFLEAYGVCEAEET